MSDRSNGGEKDTADETGDPFEAFDDLGETDPTPEELEDLFEPVETADIDDEAVWDAVLVGEDDEPVGTASNVDGADAIVPKNQYCKRCEYFSDPPEVACTHPDTEIVELVGVDRFRVTNCPVVARRERAKTAVSDEW